MTIEETLAEVLNEVKYLRAEVKELKQIATPSGIDPLQPVRIVDIAKKYHRNATALGRKAKRLKLLKVEPGGGHCNYILAKDEERLMTA